jgi:hypothetical protein
MNISSDGVSATKQRGYSVIVSTVSYLVHIVSASIILAMSYGQLTPNYTLVLVVYTLSLVASNINFSKMTGEYLQKLEDNPFSVSLQEKPILAPISMLLSFTMLGTLLTGNLYAWGTYLVYMVVTVIVSKAHKSRFGCG